MEEKTGEPAGKSDGVEHEQINNDAVKKWLRSKQKQFLQVLEQFAQETETGFETHQERDNYGEFTGRYLCGITAGVIEEAIRKKFGKSVDVYSFGMRTKYKDDPSLFEGFAMSHQIVRFKAKGESQEWTVDATYRQFQPKIRPSKLLIFPSDKEKNIYTYQEEWETAQQKYKNNPRMLEAYSPVRHKPGELLENYTNYAKTGALGERGVGRIRELLEVLLS